MAGMACTVEQVVPLLAGVPSRIATLTDGLAPALLHTRPTPDAWSANDVLAHLRACADMWGGCIAAMIAEDHPTLRAVNPTTWIRQTDYPNLAFEPSLRAFATQRAALVAVLEALPPDGWARAATVTGAGKALERTVLFYARWMARHERPHVKQIERVVGTMRPLRRSIRRVAPDGSADIAQDGSIHARSIPPPPLVRRRGGRRGAPVARANRG